MLINLVMRRKSFPTLGSVQAHTGESSFERKV